MSHNAHAAPVKFKLAFDGLWDVEEDSDEEHDVAILPETHGKKEINANLRAIARMANLADQGEAAEPVAGWEVANGRVEAELGKKLGGICGHNLVKGEHSVWYVNESQYSNVGYCTPCFIAGTNEAIEAIKADVGGRVEKDTTVMSWW